MNCPPILDQIVFADDAKLAAQLSCALSRPGFYLPVCDGPRMQRSDRHIEILRRHNAAGRARAKIVYMAGLPDDAFRELGQSLKRDRVTCHRIFSSSDISHTVSADSNREVMGWGRDRIGVGLLKALRAGKGIDFEERTSTYEWISSKTGHLVVCEEGEEISEVIAANYAFALDAGLFLIPKIEADRTEQLLEGFYKLQDRSEIPPAEIQAQLRQELLELCGSILFQKAARLHLSEDCPLALPTLSTRQPTCFHIRIWGAP